MNHLCFTEHNNFLHLDFTCVAVFQKVLFQYLLAFPFYKYLISFIPPLPQISPSILSRIWCNNAIQPVKYQAQSFGHEDMKTSVLSPDWYSLTSNRFRSILQILLKRKINLTSDRPFEKSTVAILLDYTVEPLKCFHSLNEILICFHFFQSPNTFILKLHQITFCYSLPHLV